MKKKVQSYIALHSLLLIFSLSGFFSKKASLEEPFSSRFLFYYFIVLAIMAIYAIGWQQVIKKIPLTTAYANKAVCTIWGMIWGSCFFNETVSLKRLIGAAVVIIGIVVVVQSDE